MSHTMPAAVSILGVSTVETDGSVAEGKFVILGVAG